MLKFQYYLGFRWSKYKIDANKAELDKEANAIHNHNYNVIPPVADKRGPIERIEKTIEERYCVW